MNDRKITKENDTEIKIDNKHLNEMKWKWNQEQDITKTPPPKKMKRRRKVFV